MTLGRSWPIWGSFPPLSQEVGRHFFTVCGETSGWEHAGALGRGCCHPAGNTWHLISFHPITLELGPQSVISHSPAACYRSDSWAPIPTNHISLWDGLGTFFVTGFPRSILLTKPGELLLRKHRAQGQSLVGLGEGRGEALLEKMGETCRTGSALLCPWPACFLWSCTLKPAPPPTHPEPCREGSWGL